MKQGTTRFKLQRRTVLIAGLLVLVLLFLSACWKKTEPAPPQQPSIQPPPQTETTYQGKRLEAFEYIKAQGLKPFQSIQQTDEGENLQITWEQLAQDSRTIVLNAFLHEVVAKEAAENNYERIPLAKVSFLLEDQKTIAEVYFSQNRLLGGVTYPQGQEEVATVYRSLRGETLAQLKGLDFPVYQNAQVSRARGIYYLESKQALREGYQEVRQVVSLDPGRFLIRIGKPSQQDRFYVYDTKDGTDFYTGITLPEDNYAFAIRPLEAAQLAVFLPDRLHIVDKSNFQIRKTIPYPKGEEISPDDVDITRDDKIIAYANQKGLYLCDQNFENRQILVPAQTGEDPRGQDTKLPRYPLFSPDSSKLMYRMVGYEWLEGTGVITLRDLTKKYFPADQEGTTYIRWQDNEQLYTSGPSYREEKEPALLNVATGAVKKLVPNLGGRKADFYPDRAGQLFYQEVKFLGEPQEKTEVGYYDLHAHTWHPLWELPRYQQISFWTSAYDPSLNAFIMVVYNLPFSNQVAILVDGSP